MRFELVRQLGAGAAADPDPTLPADAGDVPVGALLRVTHALRNNDQRPGRLLFTADGTAADVLSVEIWAMDDVGEDSAKVGEAPTLAELQARKFYLCTPAPLVVTVGKVLEMSAVMPPPGLVYVRVTTGPVAAAKLKVACA